MDRILRIGKNSMLRLPNRLIKYAKLILSNKQPKEKRHISILLAQIFHFLKYQMNKRIGNPFGLSILLLKTGMIRARNLDIVYAECINELGE
jgi:hypothetical protein